MKRFSIGIVGVVAILFAACRENAAVDTESARACPQALTSVKYTGEGLPPKTLALTFDDGPGVRTIELSHYLKEQGIAATFFVNGQMLTNGVAPLQALVADGHILANHTETHRDLTTLKADAIVAEVAETDALIAPFVPGGRFLFRPPFGAYDGKTFAALEASPMKKYVGPVDWDIGAAMGPAAAADWDCWSKSGTSVPAVIDVKKCGDLYLKEIRSKNHGIVLLHDPYFIDDDPSKGGTVDMVEQIVPVLKAEGYRFVTVDVVPAIAADLPPVTSQDAGVDADADASATRIDRPDVLEATSGGDSSDPCHPSPQPSPRNDGESGNLRR